MTGDLARDRLHEEINAAIGSGYRKQHDPVAVEVDDKTYQLLCDGNEPGAGCLFAYVDPYGYPLAIVKSNDITGFRIINK